MKKNLQLLLLCWMAWGMASSAWATPLHLDNGGCDGGTVTTANAMDTVFYCRSANGTTMNGVVSMDSLGTASGYSYTYIVTDNQGNILGVPPGDVVDVTGAPSGECWAFGLSYSGTLTSPATLTGQNIQTATLSNDCFDLSDNFVVIFRDSADGGTVYVDGKDDYIGACVGNVLITGTHSTTATNLSYWYIITNDQNKILGWSTDGSLDLSGAPAGECRIWGWSYRGLPNPVMGDDISTLDDDACEDISTNYVSVFREAPDGGTVYVDGKDDYIGACVGNVMITGTHMNTATHLSYWYIITNDQNKILGWSTNGSLDLSGAPAGECRIWGWSYSGLPDPIMGDDISTLDDDACEDISTNYVSVFREAPDGGTVYVDGKDDYIGACVGNVMITGTHMNTATHLSYWYIITNDQNKILGWSTNGSLDLSGAPAGECRIWGWSYSGLPDPIMGDDISTLDDDACEDISTNYVSVFREAPDGGTVYVDGKDDYIGACVGNVMITGTHMNTATHLSYWYIITNDQNKILGWSTDGSLDLSGAPAGECRIWGWSYSGLPDPIMGDDISTLDDDACEDISTNYVSVFREAPDGGTVYVDGKDDYIGACVGNVMITGTHMNTATHLSYWYIITNDQNKILGWSTNGSLDLSGAPAGECRIWGWSYSGLPDPIMGDDISTLDDDACEDISTNYVSVFREAPDGGTVYVDGKDDYIGACVGNVMITGTHMNTATHLSYWYIITNDQNKILGWSTDGSLDLSGAPAGECRIWGWSYSGLPDPIMGDDISTLDDDACEDISTNYVSVFREAPDGGTVYVDGKDDYIGACVGNVMITGTHMNTATHLSYWYIITNDQNKILGWSTNGSLDLSGAPAGECRIWGWSYSGLPDPIMGDDISTLDDDACEDISTNYVSVFREAPDGGTVYVDGKDDYIGACVGNVMITGTHMNTATHLSYWYIITNDQNKILGWSTNGSLDLSGAPAGECRIWGWSYRGLPNPVMGDDISTLDDDACEDISGNYVSVYRETPDGGTVYVDGKDDYIGACAGNVVITGTHMTTATHLSYWYIITNDQNKILGWSTNGSLDLSGAPAGECRIWGWSYRGLPNPVMGDDISTLDDDACEDISGNYVSVYRETPDGGTVYVDGKDDYIGACAGNVVITGTHMTTATHLSYWYIITNDQNKILGWSTDGALDLSGAPAGECRIWGWSYSGLPNPMMGDDISTLDDDACEDISGNYVSVFRETPDGGTVFAFGLTDAVDATVGNVLIPVSHTTTAPHLSYYYIITDDNDNILGFSPNNVLDLSGAPAGECHIWGWSYSGLPDPIMGDHISTLDDDVCESISSNYIAVIRTTSSCQLPLGYSSRDIGNVSNKVGSACRDANGVYTVTTSGTGIKSTADGFHFALRAEEGNIDLIVRVTGIQNNANRQAGLMLRDHLGPDAPNIALVVNGQKQVKLTRRASDGGPTVTVATKVAKRRLNSWLRLSRSGNTVIAYYSRNGSIWEYVGTASYTTTGRYYAGIAASKGGNGKTKVFTLDNFSVSGTAYRLANTVTEVTLEGYPNPFDQQLSYRLTGVTGNEATVRLMDLTGRLVQSQTIAITDSYVEGNLNTREITAGIYLLEVVMEGERKVMKVVKR